MLIIPGQTSSLGPPSTSSDPLGSSVSGTSSVPKTATLVLHNSQHQPVSFPVYSDAQIGLAICTNHELFEDSCRYSQTTLPGYSGKPEMDEDVASDDDVLDLAIKACSNNFFETKRYLPLDPAMRLLSIKANVKNCYIAQRVAHPELFTRSGHLKP